MPLCHPSVRQMSSTASVALELLCALPSQHKRPFLSSFASRSSNALNTSIVHAIATALSHPQLPGAPTSSQALAPPHTCHNLSGSILLHPRYLSRPPPQTLVHQHGVPSCIPFPAFTTHATCDTRPHLHRRRPPRSRKYITTKKKILLFCIHAFEVRRLDLVAACTAHTDGVLDNFYERHCLLSCS
jgi:hypothetical protein